MTKEKYVEFLKVATARGFLPGLARQRVCEVFGIGDFDSEVSDEQLDLAMFSLKRNYKILHEPVINDNGEILPLVEEAKMIPEKMDKDIARCAGPIHKSQKTDDIPIVEIGEFCSLDCQNDYYPGKPSSNFEKFLERGKKENV